MSTPGPFLGELFDETFFADQQTDYGSVPWIRGMPDQWSSHAKLTAEALFIQINDEGSNQRLWGNAFSCCYRHTLLLLSQLLLWRLMDNRVSCSRFAKHDYLVFFHINCIISSLDSRDRYKKLMASEGMQPQKWLKQILSCLDPVWLQLILKDWGKWCQTIVELADFDLSSTVLYVMWSRSDLYIRKANTQRRKNGITYAGGPHRLMEHWEGLCLSKSQCYHRPRYKNFRRQAWSDLRCFPIFLEENVAYGRLIESFAIRAMQPSANRRDTIRQCRCLKFKPAQRRRPSSWIRKRCKRTKNHSIWSFDFRP